MLEVVIRPRAIADLEEIWLYSYETWGEEQASRYLAELGERISGLAETAESGTACDAIRPGYRSVHVRRHVVFYTLNAETVGVERVLHDRMSFDRHLE